MAAVQLAFVRQAGSSGDSPPSWIRDFASILKEWKKQLENQQQQLNRHTTRIQNLEQGVRTLTAGEGAEKVSERAKITCLD